MAPPKCQLALTNLLELPASPGNAKDLVRLAARFGAELKAAQKDVELVKRHDRFETLTGENSEFDQCRATVARVLREKGTELRLMSDQPVGPCAKKITRRMILKEDGFEYIPLPKNNVLPELLPGILARLESLEGVRWDLEDALNFADGLLEIEAAPPVRSVLETWQSKIWELRSQDELENLFGCYLLMRCREAQAAGAAERMVREQLTERISGEFGRLLSIVKHAGEYLLTEAETPQGDRQAGLALSATGTDCNDANVAATTAEPPNRNTFRRENDWLLTFKDKSIRIKHQVGLKYIALLLSKTRSVICAAELIAIASGNKMVKPAEGTEMLDEQAMLEYQNRYHDLEFQLEEAKDNKDSARQEQIRRELGFLAQELKAAGGLGVRTRMMGDDADKVRKSVSIAITRAIKNIEENEHTELVLHLDNSIRRGKDLCYSPETDVDWEL